MYMKRNLEKHGADISYSEKFDEFLIASFSEVTI